MLRRFSNGRVQGIEKAEDFEEMQEVVETFDLIVIDTIVLEVVSGPEPNSKQCKICGLGIQYWARKGWLVLI